MRKRWSPQARSLLRGLQSMQHWRLLQLSQVWAPLNTLASAHAGNALTAAHLSCIVVWKSPIVGDGTGRLRHNVIHAEHLLRNSQCWTAWGIAAAWLRDARCADELEGLLKDLQFLAAAGEADTGHQNGVLVLIRSYLCLLKAEQQVMSSVISRSSTYWSLEYGSGVDVIMFTDVNSMAFLSRLRVSHQNSMS